MDAGTWNANVQFGNYAYNMSGVTTEQSETNSNAIQGESHLNNSYNGIEFTNEHFEDYELQDVEIIAIDPNSFYSETTSTSETDSSESDESGERQEQHLSVGTSFHGAPFEIQQPPNDDFDIIELNIDEEFPIDPQVDDILFKNDQQFDLASYIGGESTSLLLSPINDASTRRRMISLSDFGYIGNHNTPMNKHLPRMPVVVQQPNTSHDIVAKTPASNRRKRKNLSREFIETSDSEDEKEANTTKNSINKKLMIQRKEDDDPVWIPNTEKRGVKALKQPAMDRTIKQIAVSKDSVEKKKIMKSGRQQVQGNGLRNMLKQQLLSDRPMNKGKLLKTMSMPTGITENSIQSNVTPHPVKRIGVGRGKDIQITAKYYNCNETSDNNSVHDKNSKPDRFHQIYTDSDTSKCSSSESSESDDSDIEVNSEPTPLPKQICMEKNDAIIEINSNKEEKPRENHYEKKSSAAELLNKNTGGIKPNIRKPVSVIDGNSLDSTDFARALVTNAKKVTRTKPTASKKSNLEQQKRLIRSNMLLHNPAKFKIFSGEKSKTTLNDDGTSLGEMKTGPSLLVESKPQPAKETTPNSVNVLQQLPPNVEKKLQSVKEIKSEPVNIEVVEVRGDADVKPDVMIVDECKVESSAKRKLNIQEYLKRKNLKSPHNGSASSTNDSFIGNIKNEPIENEEISSNHAANSMYEEIIIVSMGCNTDISIPEASFIVRDGKSAKSNVLLSDIQTSVEKANSKISSMSLISSIQDVILKKTHSIEQNDKKDVAAVSGDADASNGKENEEELPEHGENKVIMHLRKDRVRPTCVSLSIQTDPYFQFPPLEKLTPLTNKKQSMLTEKRMGSIPRENRSSEMHLLHTETKNRIHRNYRGPSHLSESSYYSGDEDDKTAQRRSRHSDFMEHNAVRHRRSRRESSRYSSSKYDKYLSRHRTISRSLSSSSDNSTTSTDSSSASQSSSSSSTYISSASARSLNSYGGSSSKSYYGDDHQYYRIRTTSNNSRHSNYNRQMKSKRSKSPEERRIVYVGRIEEETTKEELRRKFSVYGQVKHVSLHHKDSKLKYGFVTFLRPCDAYTAIDDSMKNAAICHYDISFGGRRAFCREKYFDLDNSGHGFCDEKTSPQKSQTIVNTDDDSFDVLLRKVKEKMQEKK